ncbi:MAG: ribosomal-protein-alanine N-acetyltransferase [Dehalococcoidia bacterium]|nr:MAG: ribosomal-protein-alanine N-acetyltransferase [Dehalococcoidia bacterium]
MTYRVRKMRWEDVEQVRGIDLTCFPTMLPPTNYKTEFINPMAHYLVAYDDSQLAVMNDPGNQNQLVVGFIGLWYMASEMHVINLAVHPDYRHKGIGEILLIHAIELSVELKAILITLEVRVSNLAAQELYSKYGFSERGVRRAYYLDNREDAVIMTLDEMASSSYQEVFQRLKDEYARERGTVEKLAD